MPYNTGGAISEPQVWGNRMLSGFTLNNSAIAPTGGYTYPKQTALNPEAQFRMYKKNPISGENGGSGPGQWSTSSSVAHADPRKENTYHWRRPASAPMSRNVKVIPSASVCHVLNKALVSYLVGKGANSGCSIARRDSRSTAKLNAPSSHLTTASIHPTEVYNAA